MLPTIRLEPCAGQRRKLRQGSCPCVWQVGRQSMPSAEAAVSQAGPSLCPLPSRGVERVGLGSGRTARGQRSSGLGPGGVLSDRNPSPPAPVPRSWGKGLPTPPRGTAQKRGLCSPSDPTRGGHLGSTGDKLRQGRACSPHPGDAPRMRSRSPLCTRRAQTHLSLLSAHQVGQARQVASGWPGAEKAGPSDTDRQA